VVQEQRNGTGHAVRVALEEAAAQGLDLSGGPVVVTAGDAPLIGAETIALLLAEHDRAGASVTMLSAVLPDPTGYGRVVRDPDGGVAAIVEHKDADDATLAIDEVNSGTYAFEPQFLAEAVGRIASDNSQGEEYLTDLVGMARADGLTVAAVAAPDADDIMGVNNRAQLAEVAAVMRARINRAWMESGVTMIDPAATYVDVDVILEPDCTLHPGCALHGSTRVAAGAVIGPQCTLIDTVVGPGSTLDRVHSVAAVIDADCEVGPFTRLRPGTRLRDGSKAGSFVEIKNTDVGEDSKVPHLSYVGDATIGEGTNIGAATVFVNYDGVDKHRTTIGDHVRIGSDSMLVAPLEIGDGAYTAAGSVITQDVPPGALAVARGKQRNIEGWVGRRRRGTKSAEAASRKDEE
jgi:bifunctional UDP-N-acetylglucosamine pyrophosphorylase/glucosamine-1-phosphate N-acetyltransferase